MAILDLLGLYRVSRQASDLEHAGRALGAFSSLLLQFPAALPLSLIGVEQYLDANPDRSAAGAVAQLPPDAQQERVVQAAASLAVNRRARSRRAANSTC